MNASSIATLAVFAVFVVPCCFLIVREEWHREGVLRWKDDG